MMSEKHVAAEVRGLINETIRNVTAGGSIIQTNREFALVYSMILFPRRAAAASLLGTLPAFSTMLIGGNGPEQVQQLISVQRTENEAKTSNE